MSDLEITAQERAKIMHALGLVDYPTGVRSRAGKRPIVREVERAYRNRFAAGGDDVALWRGLVGRGLAEEAPSAPEQYPIFHVTQAGLDAVWAARPGDLAGRARSRA